MSSFVRTLASVTDVGHVSRGSADHITSAKTKQSLCDTKHKTTKTVKKKTTHRTVMGRDRMVWSVLNNKGVGVSLGDKTQMDFGKSAESPCSVLLAQASVLLDEQ